MSWVVTCSQCGKSVVYESGQMIPELCPACAQEAEKAPRRFVEDEAKERAVVAVGVPEITGRRIVRTLGIVCTERILGMALPRGTNLGRFNEGIAPTWTEQVKQARETAIRAILDKAVEEGANGVVGICLDYEVLGCAEEMIMVLVAARGTSVILE